MRLHALGVALYGFPGGGDSLNGNGRAVGVVGGDLSPIECRLGKLPGDNVVGRLSLVSLQLSGKDLLCMGQQLISGDGVSISDDAMG